ncbi:MAG: hypothetical protein L6R37_008182, partial [Teloschistes peruensis]
MTPKTPHVGPPRQNLSNETTFQRARIQVPTPTQIQARGRRKMDQKPKTHGKRRWRKESTPRSTSSNNTS